MSARGPWRVGARLGAGAMGQVFAVTHSWLHTPGALKMLSGAPSERARQRFRDEMRAVAALDHPNVVDVYDLADDWFVVERLGATLREAPARDWAGARAQLEQILAALAHAHAHAVVHRDVKPDNVLRADDGQAVLVDFGLALWRDEATDRVAGTPTYMAPEQYRGRDLGPWTDLYALGVVAWELVCGVPPFAGASLTALRHAHTAADLPALRPVMAVPAELGPWLEVLLEKDPRARFQTAGHALSALQGMGPPVGQVAPRPAPAAPGTTWSTQTWDGDAVGVAASTEGPARRFARPRLPEGWAGPAPRAPYASPSLFGLRAPRFVGRAAEAGVIWEALRAVSGGGGPRGVHVTGAPGVGSSRLVRHLALRAAESGAFALRWLTDVSAPDDLGDPDVPVVVVGEAGDRPDAVAVLRKLLATDRPVAVLFVGSVSGLPPMTRVALDPLDGDAQHALVASLAPFDPAVTRRLVAATGGNPQLAVELVGDALARGVVVPSDQGLVFDGPIALPDHARTVHAAWLETAWAGLPEPERTAARIAAMLGGSVEVDRWRAACEHAGAVAPGVGLDRLAARGHVRLGEERVRFLHEGTREAVATDGSPEALRAAHLACAEVVDDPVERATHLLEAGLVPEAAEALGTCGPGHSLGPRKLDAWDRVLTALGTDALDHQRVYWSIWRAWVDLAEGRIADSVRRAEGAVRDADAAGHVDLVPDALNTLGAGLRQVQRLEDAEAAFARSWALSSEGGRTEDAVLAGRMISRVARDRGDHVAGVGHARALVAFAERVGGEERVAEAHQELAMALGPCPESRALLEGAVAVFARTRRRQQELACRMELACHAFERGDLIEAAQAFQALADGLAEVGTAEAGLARLHLAACRVAQGDWPAAERLLRAARGRFGPGTRPLLVSFGRALGAAVAAAARDWERFDDEVAGATPATGPLPGRVGEIAAALAADSDVPERVERVRALWSRGATN